MVYLSVDISGRDPEGGSRHSPFMPEEDRGAGMKGIDITRGRVRCECEMWMRWEGCGLASVG